MSIYTGITIFCWAVLLTYWFTNAQKVKAAEHTQSRLSRYIYLLFMVSGFVIVYARVLAIGLLGYQIIPANDVSGITGVVVCISGVAFAIWARTALGDNWSGEVTLKKEHELIQSGPYKIVRHPIYTGFEIGLLGVAITIGQMKGLVGLSILFVNHYFKTRMEEEIMYRQFPLQYPEYAKRVKRLIPFIF
jgi:protein-S-isoprenylcysteine O-methyltransferase Ste14